MLVLLVGLFSCEKDEFQSKNPTASPDLNVSRVKLKKLKKEEPGIAQKLDFLKTSNDLLQGKGGEVLRIEIDTTFAVYIANEAETYHSYTFFVTNAPKGTYQNLLFSKRRGKEGYLTFLTTYTLTAEQALLLRSGGQMNLRGHTEYSIVEITSSGVETQPRLEFCTELEIEFVIGQSCASGQHQWGDEGCIYEGTPDAATYTGYVYNYVSVPCDYPVFMGDVPGQDPSHDPGYNPHGNGNFTIPVLCNRCPEFTNLCDKLQKYAEDSYIRDQLNQLEEDIALNDNINVETGVFFKNNGTGWGATTVMGTPSNPYINFTLQTGVEVDMFVHTHFKGLLSIFSMGDLQACYQMLKGGFTANDADFVMMLITNSGTRYAFVVSDLSRFMQIGDEHFTTTAKLNQFAKDEYDKISKDNDNATNEKEFLKMMKTIDLGITLFKANNDFSQWQKLTLDQNNNVVPIDCNQ